MPRVNFTPHLQNHLDCPPQIVEAATLREALEIVFQSNPRLRSYILDDQGRLRKHVTAFIDQSPIRDRISLTDDVSSAKEIYLLQALSGG
ncbi:MAG: MoaD/ThiS family protein [Planctomycetaceae bacterium]